jgi:benzoate/toluate 1,2-dioxygenase reductase subunit
MAYRIALNFEDGITRFIDCKAGEKILDAAYRQKINLPMDCADGVCGTCKCRCEQGVYDLGNDYIDEALSKREAAQDFVLSCQMVPSSDCVIAVPVPSTRCKVAPSKHGATVSSVERVSGSTIILKLKLDDPEGLDFLPGQYVNLGIPGTSEHRSYSFSSKPGAPEASFLIRNVPGGLVSGWLARNAAPGARVSLVGPNGSFFLRPIIRPLLMLAGGTGLAPILSMLEVLADRGCDQPIHLVYGVSKVADLAEIERLHALADRLPTFTYVTCVSDPREPYPHKGHVTDDLADEYLHAGDCDIYVCGPPPMVEAVRSFLSDKGVTPAHFFTEKFATSEPVPA